MRQLVPFSLESGARLYVGPRPRVDLLQRHYYPVDVLVSCLQDDEGGDVVAAHAESSGYQVCHAPFRSRGVELDAVSEADVQLVVDLLERGQSVLVFCSAGLHRSVSLVWRVLRAYGVADDQVRAWLVQARPPVVRHLPVED